MSRWFRMYADSMRNPKVARLSDRHHRLWVNLLSVAAENDGVIPPLEDLKHVLNARLDHLSTGVERLISEGLIDRLEVGYEPHNWNTRQYKSDTSTDRVREHRAKRNVSETPPDTETDTEQKETVPKGTAEVLSFDVRTELFRDGLAKLQAMTGKPDGACRGLIGGWLKANADDCVKVLAAIRRAEDTRPAEPVAWISAALKPAPKDWRDDPLYRGAL
jgi:hypothetical protein